MPSVYPYADKSTYRGIHGNRENNNLIPCDGPTNVSKAELLLAGMVVFQPVTFSADGQKLYATNLNYLGCNLYEITIRDGSSRCLGPRDDMSVGLGDVEVDQEGNLFFVGGQSMAIPMTSRSKVFSLDKLGRSRWPQPVTLSHPISAGLHFTPRGNLALAGVDGVVTILSREDGHLISELDIPKFLNLNLSGAVKFSDMFLNYFYIQWVRQVGFVPRQAFFGLMKGASGEITFTGNTIAISKRNQIFVTINSAEGAFLVALDLGSGDSLSYAWKAPLEGTSSSTTPSVTPDGRYISVGDNLEGLYLIDAARCDSDPPSCAPLWRYALQGSLGGNVAIDNDATIYAWNGAGARKVDDVFAIETVVGQDGNATPKKRWGRSFGKSAIWSSAITLFNNALVGTVSHIGTRSTHQLVALDPRTGDLIFSVPTDDDSSTDVSFGPDGSIYVPQNGFSDLLIPGQAWTGGVRRYLPASH